jgi:3,4-dihydroxy 2-butanone 4-phosphate synthase/GTP cyclohydrolase II
MSLPKVTRQSESKLVTEYGEFQMLGFEGNDPESPIIVLVVGNPARSDWPLVRLHSKCTTGEAFGSLQCDCKEQLDISMGRIQAEKNGVIIFLDQEARGNGLPAKLQIYQYMRNYNVTSDEACAKLRLPVDSRNYDEAVAILYELGLRQVLLLTNNPEKVNALMNWDITVVREPIQVKPNQYNYAYLMEKQCLHNHDMGLKPLPADLESVLILNSL